MRDHRLLEAARLGQKVASMPDEPAVVGQGVSLAVDVSVATALNGYRPKAGRWGTLYVRKADDCLAVVDTGTRVKVAHIDEDTVRAALAVAASKWQTLTVRGSLQFREMTAMQAVLLGLSDRIANPELQLYLANARARIANKLSRVIAPSHIPLALSIEAPKPLRPPGSSTRTAASVPRPTRKLSPS